MAISFNADEIFEMAEQIERNGTMFYRKAAENASDKQTKKMLLDMAVMEAEHLEIFQRMRKELSGREKETMVFDPENEATMYLQVMADSRGSEGKKSPTQELAGSETIKEILQIAVNAEKDSVVFYTSLKGCVSERAGKDKIENIIKQELGHLTTLQKQLQGLK